jgi:hypothetical protein
MPHVDAPQPARSQRQLQQPPHAVLNRRAVTLRAEGDDPSGVAGLVRVVRVVRVIPDL